MKCGLKNIMEQRKKKSITMNHKQQAADILKKHLDGVLIGKLADETGIAYETLNRYVHGRRTIKKEHSMVLAQGMIKDLKELFLLHVDLSKDELPDNVQVKGSVGNIVYNLTAKLTRKGLL